MRSFEFCRPTPSVSRVTEDRLVRFVPAMPAELGREDLELGNSIVAAFDDNEPEDDSLRGAKRWGRKLELRARSTGLPSPRRASVSTDFKQDTLEVVEDDC